MLVNIRELRQFVVRIDSAEGEPLGTGFFAAPGYVLTCAHVVKERQKAAVVSPVPGVDVGAGLWTVAARSAEPPPGWPSAFWPFPDLAVLQADGDVDHPCPLLVGRDPVGDERCHTWGFAQDEPGLVPEGASASYIFNGPRGYIGNEGEGFLQLAAGPVEPGLSGAPLVCPQHRAVVGVIAVSKDTRSDRGGWAAPLSALFSGEPGLIPDDLAELGARIYQANRQAVLGNRQRWNAVFPADSGDRLPPGREEGEFKREERTSPSSLLRADIGVVPYLFREAELREAVDWCDAADWSTPILVMQVIGPGGGGKTRFAIELCQRMEERGWVTRLWRNSSELVGLDDFPGLSGLRMPRLIVIDYAEPGTAPQLLAFLDTLIGNATALTPVRLLLLARHRAGMRRDVLAELGRSAHAGLLSIIDRVQDNQAARKRLTNEQRAELFRAAISEFTAAWCSLAGHPGDGVNPDDIPDLGHERYGVPLDVLFEALDRVITHCDRVHGGAASGGVARADVEPPVDRVLGHEEKYWRLTAPRPWRDDEEALYESVALATLAGADDHPEAHALLAVSDRFADLGPRSARQHLVTWLFSLYGNSGTLDPLRPDPLGEWLVIGFLRTQADGGATLIGRLCGLPSDAQAERCLDILARISAYDEPTARTAATVISTAHSTLISRAEAQSQGTPGQPGQPALARALLGLLTPQFCRLIDQALAAGPGDAASRRELASTYVRLADLAFDDVRSANAEVLYRQSLVICEALAADDPADVVLRRNLFRTYGRLAELAELADRDGRDGRDGHDGHLADAEALYRQSLTVAEELAAADPGEISYRRNLSRTYGKLAELADLADRDGRFADAAELYRQSLTPYEELVVAEPANVANRRTLSDAYRKLADVARKGGRAEEAGQWLERELQLRRQFVLVEPQRLDFAEDLAYALAGPGTADPTGFGSELATQEIIRILEPFEERGYLTSQALSVLTWARRTPPAPVSSG